MLIIVFGTSGAGKTTVGRSLAVRLSWPFFEGDAYHSPENVARMRAGLPLGDVERAPWLVALAQLVAEHLASGSNAVLACSALKRRYRVMLVPPGAPAGSVRFVFLRADRAVLEQRLRQRRGHFFAPQLLDSQLADLEPPAADEQVIAVDAAQSVDAIVQAIVASLPGPATPAAPPDRQRA